MAKKKTEIKASRKFNGKRYTKVSTSATKTAAKKKAGGLREKGKSARVVKHKKGYTVYKRG